MGRFHQALGILPCKLNQINNRCVHLIIEFNHSNTTENANINKDNISAPAHTSCITSLHQRTHTIYSIFKQQSLDFEY